MPPTAALTKGRCVHKGAEHNYRQKVETRADIALEEVQDVVAGEFDKEALATAWEKGEDKGKIKDETLALSALYHAEVAPKVQPLFIEHEFKIPLVGAGVPLLGYIDVIDEGLTIRDIKTAGSFYPNPANFMCSPKNCGYWQECHKRYGGMAVC